MAVSKGHDDIYGEMLQHAALPFGPQRSKLCATTARHALETGNPKEIIDAHLNLINAYCAGGQPARAVAPFLWCEYSLDHDPSLWDQDREHFLAWHYRDIVTALMDNPMVSVEDCIAVFDRMRDLYTRLGASLQPYYSRLYEFYHLIGDDRRAQDALASWGSATVEDPQHAHDLSDCAACNAQRRVRYHMDRRQWEQASIEVLKLVDAVVCSRQPYELWMEGLVPLVLSGRIDQARELYAKCRERHESGEFESGFVPYLLLGVDPAADSAERLRKCIIDQMSRWTSAPSAMYLMRSALAAYLVVERWCADAPLATACRRLSASISPWYPMPDLSNPTLTQLCDWLRELVFGLAERFDHRVGIRSARTLTRVRAQMERYRLVGKALRAPLAAHDDASSNDLAADPSSRIIETVNLDSVKTPAPRPEDPLDKNPIPLQIPDLQMNLDELLECESGFGTSAWSIYGYCIQEIAMRAGSSRAGMVVDERWQASWDYHCALADAIDTADDQYDAQTLDMDERSDETDAGIDAGYCLIFQARTHLLHRRLIHAGRAAYEALCQPSDEPVGIRLNALDILAAVCFHEGYLDNALDYYLQRVNLAACCGLRFVQLDATVGILEVFAVQGRFRESIDLAESMLVTLGEQCSVAVELRLRRYLARAYGEIQALGHAAEQYRRITECEYRLGRLPQGLGAMGACIRYLICDRNYEAAYEVCEDQIARSQEYLLQTHLESWRDPSQLAAREDVHEANHLLANGYGNFGRIVLAHGAPGNASHLSRFHEVMKEAHALVTGEGFEAGRTPRQMEIHWLSEQSLALWEIGEVSEAIAAVNEAVRLYKQEKDTDGQIRCLRMLARMYAGLGQNREARQNAQAGLEILANHPELVHRYLADLNSMLTELPEDEQWQ